MLPVSMPPPSSLSNSLLPVVSMIISDLVLCSSVAVVKPIAHLFIASVRILSALASLMPGSKLIQHGVNQTFIV